MLETLLALALFAPPAAAPAVDWANHTYDMGDAKITLRDGNWEHEPKSDDDFAQSLSLTGTHPLDVDGDGAPEVLVALHHWPGGSGRFDELRLYRVAAGGPVQIGEIPGGDRGDGGIGLVRVEDGGFAVERMATLPWDGSCCASLAFVERWRWQGGAMVRQIERTTVAAGPAAEESPGDAQAAIGAGRAAMKAGDPAEAVRSFVVALTGKPGDAAVTGELGFAMQKAAIPEAEAVLWSAVNAQGPDATKAAALYNLGRLYLDAGKPAPAVAALERSLALRPGNAPTTKLLAEARGKLPPAAPAAP